MSAHADRPPAPEGQAGNPVRKESDVHDPEGPDHEVDQAPQDGVSPSAPAATDGRGVRQLASAEFDGLAAIGGWRGLVESVAPGLVFVVLYVATRDLTVTLIAAIAVALVATLTRLVQRTPVTQAVGGLLGIAIGAIWAWRSGEASDFFVWGLFVNAGFAVGTTISILVGWPIVGIVVAALMGRSHEWRSDPVARRRYTVASWLWVGAFLARLAVQVPLYLSAEVGWLGTARLIMGVPLWALVLWITWILVNPRALPAAERDAADPPTT